MVQAIERYMKQAIVDKNNGISSAALVSSMVSLDYRISYALVCITAFALNAYAQNTKKWN